MCHDLNIIHETWRVASKHCHLDFTLAHGKLGGKDAAVRWCRSNNL